MVEFYTSRHNTYAATDHYIGANVVVICVHLDVVLVLPMAEWEKEGGARERLLGSDSHWDLCRLVAEGEMVGWEWVCSKVGWAALQGVPDWVHAHREEVRAGFEHLQEEFNTGIVEAWQTWVTGEKPKPTEVLLLWREDSMWHWGIFNPGTGRMLDEGWGEGGAVVAAGVAAVAHAGGWSRIYICSRFPRVQGQTLSALRKRHGKVTLVERRPEWQARGSVLQAARQG